MIPLSTAGTHLTTAAMPHTPGRLMTYDRPVPFALRYYGGTLACMPPVVCPGENLIILHRGLRNARRERTRYVSYLLSFLEIILGAGMGVGDHASANSGLHSYPLLYSLDGKVRRELPLSPLRLIPVFRFPTISDLVGAKQTVAADPPIIVR
jgi:hypothetical protein